MQKGDDTNTRVQVHIVQYMSSKTSKIHKLTFSQLSLLQMHLNLKGCDVRMHVCHENVFDFHLHVEGIQVRSYICDSQG